MNRFTNYLESQKLAKQWAVTARDRAIGKGGRIDGKDPEGAIIALINALEYQQTATNNIASLYFERRKKR